MKESHGSDPETVERQCPLCEFTCDNIRELVEHSQSIHHPYSCNICFLCFSAEYKLIDHRCEEHKISSLGTSVEVGDQGDQALELQQPENVGATKLVEPTPEEHDRSDQTPGLLPQEEPKSREPKVPKGGMSQQVEVDEVKSSEVQTQEHNQGYDSCHHFLSSNMYRYSHVTRYHKNMCRRWFMFPWDFN